MSEYYQKRMPKSYMDPCAREGSWRARPRLKKMVVDEIMSLYIGDEREGWFEGANNIVNTLGYVGLYETLSKSQKELFKKKLTDMAFSPEFKLNINFIEMPNHALENNFKEMGPDFVVALRDTLNELPGESGLIMKSKLDFKNFLRNYVNKFKKERLCKILNDIRGVTSQPYSLDRSLSGSGDIIDVYIKHFRNSKDARDKLTIYNMAKKEGLGSEFSNKLSDNEFESFKEDISLASTKSLPSNWEKSVFSDTDTDPFGITTPGRRFSKKRTNRRLSKKGRKSKKRKSKKSKKKVRKNKRKSKKRSGKRRKN